MSTLHRGPEARVQVEIMAALGGLAFCVVSRNNVGRADHVDPDTGRLSRVAYGVGGDGAPDLLCEVLGADGQWRAVWLEVKSAEGQLSPAQVRWHAAAARRGRHVFTVRSAEEALAAVRSVRGAVAA